MEQLRHVDQRPFNQSIFIPPIEHVTIKSTLTCTNCGKTDHLVETCCNKKRDVSIVPTTKVKFTKPITITKSQPIKLIKVPICYPCITYFNIEHRFGECPKKIEIQNMFRTKPINSNATITHKPSKTNNVPINIIVVVTTRRQQLE